MTTRELVESKKEVDVYSLIPELLDLKQINHLYGLAPGTIRRERWLQKKIQQRKLKAKDAEKIDTSGFGFRYEPVIMYGKIYYRRKDVEHFIKTCQEKSPMEVRGLSDVRPEDENIAYMQRHKEFFRKYWKDYLRDAKKEGIDVQIIEDALR